MKSSKGFFYTYRGNGYGPFDTRDEAHNSFISKLYSDESWIGHFMLSLYPQCENIIYGIATVDNERRLIDFKEVRQHG